MFRGQYPRTGSRSKAVQGSIPKDRKKIVTETKVSGFALVIGRGANKCKSHVVQVGEKSR